MTETLTLVWRIVWYTRLSDLIRGRLDASLDWRTVVANSYLPAEVQGVVEQVVRGTRLWRDEKVAVATELVAHFQDGLDAGHSPSDLVHSFGDVRQTAKLIHRAKKRGRPLVWHLCRYGWWAIGAMTTLYFVAVLWMSFDRPEVKTDYLALINERASLVPPDERAWPLYREAFQELGIKLSQPYAKERDVKPGDADWEEAVRFLHEHAASMAKLREAASRPELGLPAVTSYWQIPPDDRELLGGKAPAEQTEQEKIATPNSDMLISTLLPDLQLLREASALLVNDARRAAVEGDSETAVADVRALLGISHHCEEKPFLVSLLVANVVQRKAFTVIQDIMRDDPALWTNDQLRDLAHEISTATIDWRRGLIAERAMFYDVIQRLYTDDGHGDGRLALYVPYDARSGATIFDALDGISGSTVDSTTQESVMSDALAMLALPALNAAVASRREMIEMYDQLMSRAEQEIETPLWEIDSDAPTIYDEIKALVRRPLGRLKYMFVDQLFPAYHALRASIVTLEGSRDGVLIGIALELYYREHGKWPESLVELSPRWLPELPVDRITGKPLQFRVIDDRPVVYSVGTDGDDDGGRLPKSVAAGGSPYAIGPVSALPADASESVRDQKDGDWVIWSTMKQIPVMSE